MPVEAPERIEMDTTKITEVDLKYLDFDTSSLSTGKIKQDLDSLLSTYTNKHGKHEKDDLGVVAGRFQPPHLGHLYQILAGLEVAKELVVVIGSANADINNPDPRDEKAVKLDIDNPFPATEREFLLTHLLEKIGKERNEDLLKRVSFVHLDDVGNNEKWGNNLVDAVEAKKKGQQIDVIVANDGWVKKIFDTYWLHTFPVPFLKKPSGKRYEATGKRVQLRDEGRMAAKGAHIVVGRG